METTIAAIISAITEVGFPIAMVIGLCWFVYRIYQNTTQENKDNMAAVQERCKEREEKLYTYLEKAQEINGQAIATLARYDEKLDLIQEDLDIIKNKVLNN